MTASPVTRFAILAAACTLPFAIADAQTAPADYSNSATAPGSWSYVAIAGGSEARFMDATGTIRLVVGCSRATRQVTIARTSAAPAASVSVWTSSLSRDVPARFEPNAMRVSAQLAAFDGLLDAIVFSRGRFAVSMPGFSALVVTAGPEAARVIEDCRS